MNNGPTLSLGSNGSDVKRLQRLFVQDKTLSVDHITGIFDATLQQVVKDFQQDVGLVPDGIVGTNTWHKLPADPNTPLLKVGSTGTAVSGLQGFLKRNSPPGPNPGTVDGHFGPLTKAAVIFYQNDRGLTPDGIVGDKTWWSPAGAAGAVLASLSGLTSI